MINQVRVFDKDGKLKETLSPEQLHKRHWDTLSDDKRPRYRLTPTQEREIRFMTGDVGYKHVKEGW